MGKRECVCAFSFFLELEWNYFCIPIYAFPNKHLLIRSGRGVKVIPHMNFSDIRIGNLK